MKRASYKGLAVDSLILTFVRIITAIVSIICYKLIATTFSLNEYGIYSQAMLVSTTVTSITILGLTDAINYFYNKEIDEKKNKRYVTTAFFSQFVIGLICAIIVILCNKQISLYFGNIELTRYLPIIAFLPLVTNLINMIQILFVSNARAKALAVRNFVISVVKIIFITIICLFIKDIKFLLFLNVALEVVSLGYMVIYCHTHLFRFSIRNIDFVLIREIFAYSIPMSLYIMTNTLSKNMDKLIIGNLGSTEEMALYSVAAKELPFDLLTGAFLTVLIPYITRSIAKKQDRIASKMLSNYVQLSYVLTWIVGIGTIFLSHDLMLILYDKKYLPALGVFCLYLIVDMMKFANVSLVFSAKGKAKELLLYSCGAVALNFVLNIVLYNVWGMFGRAFSTVLVTFAFYAVVLSSSAALIDTSVCAILNIRQTLILLIETTVAGSIAFVISRLLPVQIPVFLRFIICYAIYILPLLMLNWRKILNLLRELNSFKLIENRREENL